MGHMKVIRLILPVLLLATTGFAQKVWSKFQPAADFTKYKTYKWVPIQSTDQIDALANQQLKAAVDAELAKKGLIKTEGAEADLFVGYQVAFRKPTEWSASTEMPGPDVVREGGSLGDSDYAMTRPIGTTTVTSTLRIGDFGLDIYDPARRQVVWRGDVARTLLDKVTPEKRKKNIEKGVAKLLKDYPPKKK